MGTGWVAKVGWWPVCHGWQVLGSEVLVGTHLFVSVEWRKWQPYPTAPSQDEYPYIFFCIDHLCLLLCSLSLSCVFFPASFPACSVVQSPSPCGGPSSFSSRTLTSVLVYLLFPLSPRGPAGLLLWGQLWEAVHCQAACTCILQVCVAPQHMPLCAYSANCTLRASETQKQARLVVMTFQPCFQLSLFNLLGGVLNERNSDFAVLVWELLEPTWML